MSNMMLLDLDDLNMEEPCKCQCGQWFELEEGYQSIYSSTVICVDCANLEDEEQRTDDADETTNVCQSCGIETYDTLICGSCWSCHSSGY